jgi:hypothetical protein
MKHQHHGCLPLQMFARAVAEQQSLSLYSRCRHPLERDIMADHGESRGWFAFKLDWKCCVMRSEGTGLARIVRAGRPATRCEEVSRLKCDSRTLAACDLDCWAALTLDSCQCCCRPE